MARIWRDYLRRRLGPLLTAMALAGVTAVLTGVLLRLLEPAVNGLFVERNPRDLWLIPLAIVCVGLVRGLASMGQALLVNRIGHGLVGEIQVALFQRMVHADLARLKAQHSGSYVASVLFDANLVREAFTKGAVDYVQHGLTLIVLIGFMLSIDPLLTVVVLLAIPAVNAILRVFSRRTRKAASGAMNETSVLSTALMENLDGIRVVKIENRESAEEARITEVIRRRQKFVIKGADARALSAPVSEMISMTVVAAVMLVAGWQAQQGAMNVGQFAAYIGLLMAAGQAVRHLSVLQTIMSEGFTASSRLFDALDVEPEIRDSGQARAVPEGPLSIELRDVDFAYGQDAHTLQGVSMKVEPGETVALVGTSGGGKSTILSLIPRFYDVAGGSVRVGDADVRELSLASLRSRIALVTQEPFLFDDTIAANIAYGRPEAGQDEIEAAARAAAAHDFIMSLPQGYATRVGEAGGQVSGGQRQRIAIARAFLKDAPILLLDEATSALDTESETLVQSALEELMKGRSTLIIAHRLSTVARADRIYVISGGRVVQQGTHASLSREDGLYARLARSQNLSGEPLMPEMTG
ncbi:MAG: ABC transporter ATP-binding protein [Brevundimonas sp.]|uniref:ABC transporter ATP-binding protein n=1 Tax=Brevundimonas sp. TaxID=1871086 RepID=UPI00391CB85B